MIPNALPGHPAALQNILIFKKVYDQTKNDLFDL